MASSESEIVPPSKANLFLISLLILFVELACIRWFPAHVLYLTFFTNLVLLAAFLGMSLGCLIAQSSRRWLKATPYLLFAGLAIAFGFDLWVSQSGARFIDVGNQQSPELIYFGTEYHSRDLANFVIPIEAIGTGFFLLITMIFVGLGQELGRALNRIPNRVQAYTINIFGSIVGIVLFALISWCELSPFWWFLPAVLGLAWFLWTEKPYESKPFQLIAYGLLVATPLIANSQSVSAQLTDQGYKQHFWSPYYRIDYTPHNKIINVNLIGHQQMISHGNPDKPAYAYPLPYLLNRDAGGEKLKDVLIIGAGSGNDVSRALQWGAEHVDAVEIDPAIHRLGTTHHPDKPFDDERVTVHLDDGRNFLRATEKKYDLIVYALVDSLVLHSSYSNIRLESYLFTRQAFEDVKSRLKPGGMFVMYNYFRQGWVVARLREGLKGVFEKEPIVFGLPYQETIISNKNLQNGFTIFLVGDTDHIQNAFKQHEYYRLKQLSESFKEAPNPSTPNGFTQKPPEEEKDEWIQFGPAKVIPPDDELKLAEDDWPFLYLRRPTIPDFLLRGMLLMGGIALLLILLFMPKSKESNTRWQFSGRMFFLGAGFMLIETKAVVHMALLFGSTWIVNTVVFFAVLVMILLANLFVLKVKPEKLWPYYVGLFISLILNVIIPLDAFLGMNRVMQIVGGCLLTFTPILFAGVIFAVSFSRTRFPDLAFGANIAGAMLGGLAESTSMLIGFRYMVLVAIGLYLLSMLQRSQSRLQEN